MVTPAATATVTIGQRRRTASARADTVISDIPHRSSGVPEFMPASISRAIATSAMASATASARSTLVAGHRVITSCSGPGPMA